MRDGARVASPAAEACLGQIRQAISCTADITLESTTPECDGENSAAAASGQFVDHKCRDWVQVRNYVEDNQKMWSIETKKPLEISSIRTMQRVFRGHYRRLTESFFPKYHITVAESANI
jgi:hypothetical protein